MTGDPEMDAADFAAYVEARRGYYLHLARQYLGNQQDAEDALAEAVCLGLRKLPDLREDGGIHAWMRRIVYQLRAFPAAQKANGASSGSSED